MEETEVFFFVALFITLSNSAHDTYFLYRYPVEKITKTPMRGFCEKPLQRVFDWDPVSSPQRRAPSIYLENQQINLHLEQKRCLYN